MLKALPLAVIQDETELQRHQNVEIFFHLHQRFISQELAVFVYTTVYSKFFYCTVGAIIDKSKFCVDHLWRTV